MKIAPPAVSFIPPQPVSIEEPHARTVEQHADAADQPLMRSKRAIKGFSWFGRRPSAPPSLPSPGSIAPAPIPRPPTPAPKPLPKPGPSVKPGQPLSVDKFKEAGQAIVHANKIKVSDELLMTQLRKQAPISVAEAAKRVIDANSLVKAGVISTGPNASRVPRDAFISAGITGLVSAPINVAAYAGSVASGESIKSSYAPGVLPSPFLPGAASPPKAAGGSAPVQSTPSSADPISAQLDEVEMKLLGMATTVMFTLGDTSRAFTKDDTWPTDNVGRLGNLEKLLGVSEQHLKKASRQNGLVFKPYKPGSPIPTEPKDRLDLMEKKFACMTEAYEKLRFLAAMKDSQNKAEASA